MPFNVTTLGATNTPAGGATSLSLTTGSNFAAGGQIYLMIASDTWGFDNLGDGTANAYVQVAGSTQHVNSDVISAFIFHVDNNLRVPNNSTIRISLASGTNFNARMAAFGVSGLTSGVITASSAGQGADTAPSVALDTVPANNNIVGIVGVRGPSSDGFTQDPAFTSPGTLNTETTTAVSVYSGFQLKVGTGQGLYNPRLGVARPWVALMVSLTP